MKKLYKELSEKLLNNVKAKAIRHCITEFSVNTKQDGKSLMVCSVEDLENYAKQLLKE